MSKKPSKRKLQTEVKRQVRSRVYPKESASTLHHISDEGHFVNYIHKMQPLITDTTDNSPLEPPPADQLSALQRETDQVYESHEERKKGQTQTRKAIDEYMQRLQVLEEEIMSHYANDMDNAPCGCGRGPASVKCHDCLQYITSCVHCFIDRHQSSPLHWALVWDAGKGHFEKCDYGSLLPDGPIIQLGHSGEKGLCDGALSSVKFTIVHSNGIHGTRVRFCGCLRAPDHFTQLLRARLLPATAKDPKTAFTFNVMKEFSLLNIQSKCGAFDYMFYIQRLTDNVFMDVLPDHYKALLRVSRIWEHITTKKRVGQLHNVDKSYPNRPNDSAVMFCPACPEPGVNTELEPHPLGVGLKHLNTLYLTLDGNHHCNRHKKNTDPDDRSLWNGTSYFPRTEDYQDYLNGIPLEKEKSVCSFISAVNGQDRKKFIGNDETGLINAQCSHVFVLSSVDMYRGERFAYTDFVLARALDQRIMKNVRLVVAYDIACSYSVNILKRYEAFLTRHSDTIDKTQFVIDSLHVNDHIDRCMYLFSPSYQSEMAHFHGVGTEQYWSENNQLGPQTRQMNKGHRQDKVSEHHGDWNWKKTVKISEALWRLLVTAWNLYTKKKDHFQRLCDQFHDKIHVWYRMDQKPTIVRGDVKSVYRHATGKIPSLKKIQESFLRTAELPSQATVARSVHFLTEGILIEARLVRLRLLIERHTTHPLLATEREITQLRISLSEEIEIWRGAQTLIAPLVRPMVRNQPPCEVENEQLFLPSHFTAEQRSELKLKELASEEVLLREGQACDSILQLRRAVKSISAARGIKKKNEHGQQANTRARSKIETLTFDRDCFLDIYQLSRDALVVLGLTKSVVDVRFPMLTEKDLFRKSTVDKRELGDTFRADGNLWTAYIGGGLAPGEETEETNTLRPRDPIALERIKTRTSTRMIRRHVNRGRDDHQAVKLDSNQQHSTHKQVFEAQPRKDGAEGSLWRPITGVPDEEIEAWELEEDRVQWHRAWADMMRWLEEFELKHLEFLRTIKSFDSMTSFWRQAAKEASRLGFRAFANRQASIYASLHSDTVKRYEIVASKQFRHSTLSGFHVDVQDFRQRELSWFTDMVKSADKSPDAED